MTRLKFRKPRVRKRQLALAIVAVFITAGTAFAMLQSRSILTGNTISTASANLLISTDGTNYSQAVPGFSFSNIIPGGYPAPVGGYPIYLRNTGSTDLDLRFALDNPPSNPGSVDLTKISVDLIDVSGSTAPRGFTLQSLLSDGIPMEGSLAPGETRQYKLQTLATDGAAAGVTVKNIDFVFAGIAHDPNTPGQ